jgi:hypothetical protein
MGGGDYQAAQFAARRGHFQIPHSDVGGRLSSLGQPLSRNVIQRLEEPVVHHIMPSEASTVDTSHCALSDQLPKDTECS